MIKIVKRNGTFEEYNPEKVRAALKAPIYSLDSSNS